MLCLFDELLCFFVVAFVVAFVVEAFVVALVVALVVETFVVAFVVDLVVIAFVVAFVVETVFEPIINFDATPDFRLTSTSALTLPLGLYASPFPPLKA